MNKRKNIESLFQEKFKNFEVAPPEITWTNIKSELEKKKQKKRTVPFWWKISGVAALLLLGFFVGNNFNNDTNNPANNAVVTKEKQPTKNNSENKKNSSENNFLENETLVNKNISDQEVVTNAASEKNQKSENQLVSNYISSKKVYKTLKNKKSQKTDDTNMFIKYSTDLVSNPKNEPQLVNSKSDNIVPEKEIKITNLISEIISKTESNNNSLDNKTIKIDSAQIELVSQNKLEEILKEKANNKTNKKASKTNKWQITTNVSPIYANSNAKGSAIDQKYVNNEKTYENNISLGIGVNYALTKKVKIRTGINKFSLGFNTNNVGFYNSETAVQTLNNVPVNSNQSIAFVDNTTNEINILNEASLAGLPQIISVEKATINQKLGYYEVPVELSYALIDKRFGINLIGGISTLFLNENKISTITKNSKIDTGKANNLNNIHFSTNIGMGFKYNLIKSIQINIDPMLKYQINTFSNDVGGFKPYFFGIYSGINYQF